MKKILIVEDEPVTPVDLKKILEENGYAIVDRVLTGESAIKSFEEHQPDIIIMDIHLKGKMTGIDAAKEIVQFSKPHFVFLAGVGYEEYLKDTGIDYVYLQKPFNEEKLLALIKEL